MPVMTRKRWSRAWVAPFAVVSLVASAGYYVYRKHNRPQPMAAEQATKKSTKISLVVSKVSG